MKRIINLSAGAIARKTVVSERAFALLWMPLVAILAGCQTAATVKLPPEAVTKIQSVLVVPMEAPPLEVYPDLLETEQPVYHHFHNMALPIKAEEKVYWRRGGLLMAGQVGAGDEVQAADFNANASAMPTSGLWSPTFELASAAALHLQNASVKTDLASWSQQLPIAAEDRKANLSHWRTAIEKWYAQNSAATNYRQLFTKPADVVLEVGINRYRIFYGQTTIQVLLKLIDPNSGRVLAKTGKETRLLNGSPEALLYPEGEGLKSLIRNGGSELLAQGFQDMGLTSLRLSELTEP